MDAAERTRRPSARRLVARLAARVGRSHPALLLLAVSYLAAAILLSGVLRMKPASAAEWNASSSGQFRTTSVEILDIDPWPNAVSDQPEPWYEAPIPTFDYQGATWEHPSRQLQFGLTLLVTYDDTGDPRYLAAAERLGEHVLRYAVTSRGGLFFPYDFVWYGSEPRWYSALTEGKGLGFFSRLWERTGEDRWRRAADAVFRTFTLAPSESEPWVAFVDERGYLWLEEYPGDPVPAQVLNGHMAAVYGLYEYNRVFASPDAERLLRGGLATVIERGHEFRVLGGHSYYGLRDGVQKPSYHEAHVRMLGVLADMTGSPELAELSGKFARDSAVAPQRGAMAAWTGLAGLLLLGVALLVQPRRVRPAPAPVAMARYIGPEST